MPETDVPLTNDPEMDDPETDVPETKGRDGHPLDGWHRQMALRGKAWTEGSSVFMDILLCHLTWPFQSRRQMAPRRIFEKYLAWSLINGGYKVERK